MMEIWRCPECGLSLWENGRVAPGTVLVRGLVLVMGGEPVNVDGGRPQGWHEVCLAAHEARINEALGEAADEARAAVVAEAEAIVRAAAGGQE